MLVSHVIMPSLVSAIGWGVSPIFNKLNMKETQNNYILVFFLHCIIIGILGILVSVCFLSKLKNISKYQNISKILIYALFGAIASTVLGYYYYFRALAHTNNTLLVVLIVYIIPLLVTSFISHFFMNEKINLGMFTGLLISIIGICIFAYFTTKLKKSS